MIKSRFFLIGWDQLVVIFQIFSSIYQTIDGKIYDRIAILPKMSENGLPKATMVNFIKDRISDKRKVSAEFTNVLLDLSKQFIDKISSHANEICQKEGKKTINNDHFYQALKEMGMGDIIADLQKTDQILKKKMHKKNQQKARVQQNIDKLNKRQSEVDQQKQKERLPILESISSKDKPINLIDEQQNFVQILEQGLEQEEDEDVMVEER